MGGKWNPSIESEKDKNEAGKDEERDEKLLMIKQMLMGSKEFSKEKINYEDAKEFPHKFNSGFPIVSPTPVNTLVEEDNDEK